VQNSDKIDLPLCGRNLSAHEIPLLAHIKFPGNGRAWCYAQAAFQIRDCKLRIASAQLIFPEKT
jgi:hypothetical protein